MKCNIGKTDRAIRIVAGIASENICELRRF
jgi:hypothetical protein